MRKRTKIDTFECSNEKCSEPKKRHFVLLEGELCPDCYSKKHKGFGANKGGCFGTVARLPRKPPVLTTEQKAEIVSLNKKKWANGTIAELLDLPIGKVQRFIATVPDRYKAVGNKGRVEQRDSLGFDSFEALTVRINELVLEGMGCTKIARALNATSSKVKSAMQIMDREGILVKRKGAK